MLTAELGEQERALLTVARAWNRLEPHRQDADRVFVAIVAVLHLLGAVTLLLAPRSQLFTQGTRPVFDLFPPSVWAVAFVAGGASAATLLIRVTGPRQVVTWVTVLPTQAVWLGASLIAVSRGLGSAMGIVFLSAVLAFTIATALVTAVDFTTRKR